MSVRDLQVLSRIHNPLLVLKYLCMSLLFIYSSHLDARLRYGMTQGIEAGLLKKGDVVVMIQGWKGGLGNTNTMRVLHAE